MTEISIMLGVLLKAFFEVEIAVILLKSILAVFLKRDNAVLRMLSYAIEPAMFPVRFVVSKSAFLFRFPIDMITCITFLGLISMDMLFGTWF